MRQIVSMNERNNVKLNTFTGYYLSSEFYSVSKFFCSRGYQGTGKDENMN